jgi:probable F420-dependent oxidoreductase
MKIGLVYLPTDRSAPLHQLAVAAEERGFGALLVGDHTHIPARRTTPFIAGDVLPDEYYRLVDPFVALASGATVTTRIELGTCICLVAQRDPIVTAKQVASVDHLSGGRFIFGIGYGWNVEEAADHRIQWADRRERVREYIGAMRALWTEEQASFQGRFVGFDGAIAWPKPKRRPTPPVLLGASPTDRVFGEVVDWADGWLPVPFLGHQPEDVARLRRMAEDRGRDSDSLSIIVDGLPADPALMDPWVNTGVDAILVPAESEPLDAILPVLDAAVAVIERYSSVAAPAPGRTDG